MDLQRKLTKARSELVLDQPFFGTLLLRLKVEENAAETETLATDGKKLQYNPEYVDRLSLEELKAGLAHTIMHVALLHHTRRGARDPQLWNIAGDFAVNPILLGAGFKLPQPYIYAPEYEDMSAEAIYNKLQEQQDEKEGGGQDEEQEQDQKEKYPPEAMIGEVRDAPSPSDPTGERKATAAEMDQIENETKVMVQQAAQAAASVGKMPRGTELAIDELLEPRIPWREKLSRFLAETARNDYNWTIPNRRYIYHGVPLPALQHPEISEVVVMMDTSGSITKDQLTMMASEVMDLLSLYQSDPEILFLYLENQVAGHERISAMEFPENFNPVGGGGTDFRPGFDWLEEEEIDPNVVIYFTDGICQEFPEEPDYPVIWVLPFKNEAFDNPFGEVAYIQE
jgi:predicted metal-dependent peptidase